MELKFVHETVSAGRYAGKALQFIIRRFLRIFFLLCAMCTLVLAYFLGKSIAAGSVLQSILYFLAILLLCCIRWADTFISKIRFKKLFGRWDKGQTVFLFQPEQMEIVGQKKTTVVPYASITHLLDAPYSVVMMQKWKRMGIVSKLYDTSETSTDDLLSFLKARCTRAKFYNLQRLKVRKLRHLAFFVILLLVFASSLIAQLSKKNTPVEAFYDLPNAPSGVMDADTEGNVRVTLPEDLVGMRAVAETLDAVLRILPEGMQDSIFTTYEDEQGRVTYVLTQAQYTVSKETLYEAGMRLGHLSPAIVEVVYEDTWLTEITVFVDSEAYKKNVLLQVTANEVLANIAGIYQVFSGFGLDEWNTTITVRDAETEDLFSRDVYFSAGTYTIESAAQN